MDVVSHGLWGSVAFGRKNKRLFWLAFIFGVWPDVFAFGYFFIVRLLSGTFTRGPFPQIPSSIYTLYDISHSLIISLVILGISLLVWKKKALLIAAWPLHVFFDMFTHDVLFFPTPWLWPLATPYINGIPWSTPWVFFLNWGTLIILYAIWISKRKNLLPK